MPSCSASSYVCFLFHAHWVEFQSGVVVRKNSARSARYRENAATVSSRVGYKTQFLRLRRRPTSRTESTVLRSSLRSSTRTKSLTYLENREIDCWSSTTDRKSVV